VQAVIASVILILVPLWVGRAGRGVGPVPWGRARLAFYFMALGFGFLFIEMAFIQRFVLFLGHPLYAIAVVLAAFLVFAGLGSGMAERVADWLQKGRLRIGAVPMIAAAILVVAGIYLAVLPILLDAVLAWPEQSRIALAVLLVAPLAFFMGMPFPLGLKRVSVEAPTLIPWAWGINGCASVLSAVLATLLAIHIGFTAVVGCALMLYALAAVMFASGTAGQGGTLGKARIE
jgi:hypothetical protein